ncbi:hypothetical protein LUZ60_017758 [Juncus effusus]|nr:hypothetical protein LUZ60_017758 [Juncus effusus]
MTIKPYSLPLLSFLSFLLLSLSFAQDDAAALLKIKEQLGNPFELSDWVAGSDYCTWRYIYCSSSHRARFIWIQSINVNAPLPSAFSELTELETLYIEQMPGLYGSIPASFGNLSHLQIFNIIDTSISGPIPESLCSTNITSMALFNNKLTGSIPACLSTLPYLYYLNLANNSLTGRIPSGLVHGSTTMPMWLILHHNSLTGKLPKYYGGPNFDTVNVGYNLLRGNPSFLFGRKKRFVDINLSWNDFEFDLTNVQLPDTLRFLDVSHNRIKGKVPMSLINVRVAVLDFSYNQLCGEIPTGGYMSWHKANSYAFNKCLCGTPLPPCAQGPSP